MKEKKMRKKNKDLLRPKSYACPCPENEMRTLLCPGVSTSDGLSDSSSPFLRFFLFRLWVLSLGKFSATVGVEVLVAGVASSCC